MSLRTRRLARALAFLALAPRVLHADCTTTPLWSHLTSVTAMVSNTGSSALNRSYQAVGSAVYAYRNFAEGSNLAGTAAWVWSPVPSATTLTNFPSPVPMHSGGEFIYVAGDDGRLYKLNAASPAGPATSIDTKRGTCAQDKIVATPTIQLYAFSNPAYQAVHNRDLVFVPTRTGCGDATQNRIFAVDASTLAVQWIFNSGFTKPMDYAAEGCAIDYPNNRIYCGTNDGGASQPTLWAISTIDGSLVWSANAGPILNRPMLSNNRLYVATSSGLKAYDAFGGASMWPSPVPLPSPIVRNPWVEFRGGFHAIYFVTADGFLHAYRDMGPGATEIWPASDGGGVGYTSMPVVLPEPGNKLYVGRNDGFVQQIDVNTAVPEVAVQAAPPGTIYDPTLDVGLPADPTPNRLLVSSANVVHRYCVPWSATVAVRDEFHPGPAAAVLRSNAPNPFRESTRIDYELALPGRVEIAVFDVAGKRLRSWAREHAAAGAQSLVWDGNDDAGRRAPSGVYFCRLRVQEAGGRTTERARTVLRLE
jgi:flagellar hook capping protein FlgD/putative pyrroloquinoline-quinone binding quinoprotein